MRVVVHGAELVAERREQRAAAVVRAKVERDAEVLREAIEARPGLGTMALRELVGLPGARYRAAMGALGDVVEVRQTTSGRTTTAAHFLKGNR